MPDADQSDRPHVVVVQRWRRFGYDRAYVRIDDADVGYRDLKTGEMHCARADHAPLVAEATDSLVHVLSTSDAPAGPVAEPAPAVYRARHRLPDPDPVEEAPAQRPRPARRPGAVLPDRDLALNQPGAAARAQASALRDAAPIHAVLARALNVKTDERAFRIGADGEAEVARRLQRLDSRWRVLHAIPVGEQDSDIDHIVIGPAGVFTINTKNHPNANVWVRGDTFKVNGFNQHYIRNSRHEVRRAARLLSEQALFDVDVRGIVAVVGAQRGVTVSEQPHDSVVTVIAGRAVAEHLAGRPDILGAPSIERIYEVARHLATWQPKTVMWQDFD